MKALIRKTFPVAAAVALPALAGAQTYAVAGHPQPQIRVSAPLKPRVVVLPVGRGYLGVQLVDITEELREFYGAPREAGVLVSRVAEDSPAAAAGFEVGDVITAVSGDAVKSSREVVRVMGRLEPEHEVSVAVVRAGAPLTLSATVGEREETARFFTHLPQLPDLANLEYLEVLRDELPRIMVQNEEAEEAMRRAFEEARERMQDFDYGALADRLAEAEDRLRELERKLEEKER